LLNADSKKNPIWGTFHQRDDLTRKHQIVGVKVIRTT
jgi:hypothetical protein